MYTIWFFTFRFYCLKFFVFAFLYKKKEIAEGNSNITY
jgi:hypothetical protein